MSSKFISKKDPLFMTKCDSCRKMIDKGKIIRATYPLWFLDSEKDEPDETDKGNFCSRCYMNLLEEV